MHINPIIGFVFDELGNLSDYDYADDTDIAIDHSPCEAYTTPKCECGACTVGSPNHSDYCPMYRTPE